MRISHGRVFYKSAARDFKQTGAVAPSSRSLGHAMTSEMVRRYKAPAAVLEVGGGTGCITEVIAQCLKAGDHLDVYEIDAGFSDLLNRRVIEDRHFQHIRTAVSIHNRPIQEIDRQSRYDFIISCLPFTNFQPTAVREIFEIYRSLLKPGGVCSYFEYLLLREAVLLMRRAAERKRITGVAQVVEEYVSRYGCKRDIVLMNVPPAMVHHLCFTSA